MNKCENCTFYDCGKCRCLGSIFLNQNVDGTMMCNDYISSDSTWEHEYLEYLQNENKRLKKENEKLIAFSSKCTLMKVCINCEYWEEENE